MAMKKVTKRRIYIPHAITYRGKRYKFDKKFTTFLKADWHSGRGWRITDRDQKIIRQMRDGKGKAWWVVYKRIDTYA